MLYPSPAQDRQPSGPTPLLRELQQYCPGYFSTSEFGMFGHRRAPLEGNIGVRVTHGIAGYAGNGTTKCAAVPWQGINLNTQPAMTWVLVYKKNATGIQGGVVAGFGATGGSTGNTLFRFVGGVDSANAIRVQIRDGYGTEYINTDSSDFGADDLRYHCVVVSGIAGPLSVGGGLQYYADGQKLNFIPSATASGVPLSTLFNIATLLCSRRGGTLSGADGNYDVALFVPLFGVRQPDWWCQEVSRNPWQLFESERRIWMPEFVAGGTSPVTSDLGVSYTIRARAESDLAAAFAIRQTAQADLEASYALRGRAEADLTAGYSIQATVSSDLVGSFNIRERIEQDLTASYTLRAQVEQDLEAAFTVRKQVQQDLAASYVIESGTSVTSDFTASYDIRAQVESDLAAAYPIRGAVQSDLVSSYAIRKRVEQDLGGSFDILATVAADLTASWTIRAEVERDLTASYLIQSSGGGGGGPSAEEIAAAVLSAMNTNPPGVDVKRMNGAQVIGTGAPDDLWRGV